MIIKAFAISLILFLLSCTSNPCEDKLDGLKDYKLISVGSFNKTIDIGDYETMELIRTSKPIKESVKSGVVTQVKLCSTHSKDTISITIIGTDARYFVIGDCYYESEAPLLPAYSIDSIKAIWEIK